MTTPEEHLADIESVLDRCHFLPGVIHKSTVQMWRRDGKTRALVKFDGVHGEFDSMEDAMKWLGATWLKASHRQALADDAA